MCMYVRAYVCACDYPCAEHNTLHADILCRITSGPFDSDTIKSSLELEDPELKVFTSSLIHNWSHLITTTPCRHY